MIGKFYFNLVCFKEIFLDMAKGKSTLNLLNIVLCKGVIFFTFNKSLNLTSSKNILNPVVLLSN